MTSMPLVRRTFATLRWAELGFFGVRVITCVQTPRLKGPPPSAGDFDLPRGWMRGWRMSWLMVGMVPCFAEKRALGHRTPNPSCKRKIAGF